MPQKTIVVEKVDVELLRKQRNELVELAMGKRHVNETDLDGPINLIDAMLDSADEFNVMQNITTKVAWVFS